MNKTEANTKGLTISEEQARIDVEHFFKSRRITKRIREKHENDEECLVDSIMEGLITINENGVIEQTLVFPTEGDKPITKLTYKTRMSVDERSQAVKGIKPEDGEGRLRGYVAQLTNQPHGVIKKLETGVDYEIASSIASYFL